MTARLQTSLFPDAEPAAEAAALVAVHRPRSALGKMQQKFNRLSREVCRARDETARWLAYQRDFESRVAAEIEPRVAALNACRRRLLFKLDAVHADTGQRLPKRVRAALPQLIIEIAGQVLGDVDDPDIEALLEAHGGASRSERARCELELTEAMLSDVFGPDIVVGFAGDDSASLLRHAEERLHAAFEQDAAAAHAQANASGGGRSRRAARDAERERAAQEAGQSLREVYRKLASALHPDRAVDADERVRRTALMKRVNQAYESNDLLALLGLQIEIEQIDVDHFANVPDAKLRHYVDVLREQLQTLQAQRDALLAPMLASLQLMPTAQPSIADVERALSAEAVELARTLEQASADLDALDDPSRRRAVLEALCAELDQEDVALAELLDVMLMSPAQARAPAQQRKRSKRRKRPPR